MNAEQIIAAHAKRLGLPPERLTEALLSYAASELADWTTEQENDDPGSVWCVGDPPDFLKRFLPELAAGEAF